MKENNTRIIAILVILLILLGVWSLFELNIINDKTELIIKERNEKQVVIYEYEELLEKYTSIQCELDKYKKEHGEIDD